MGGEGVGGNGDPGKGGGEGLVVMDLLE